MASTTDRAPVARPRLGGAHRRRKDALARIGKALDAYVPRGVRSQIHVDGGLGTESGKASLTVRFDGPIDRGHDVILEALAALLETWREGD